MSRAEATESQSTTDESDELKLPSFLTGLASWYGPGFAGKPTAAGEPFDAEDLTAASRDLPLGSKVLVTNPRNGRSVLVRINDRGPFVKGRSIDLSRRAADILGIIGSGTAKVTISLLGESGASPGTGSGMSDSSRVRIEIAHVQPGIHPDSSPLLAARLASASGASAGRVARMLAAAYVGPGNGQLTGGGPSIFAMALIALAVGLAVAGQVGVRMQSLAELGLATVGLIAKSNESTAHDLGRLASKLGAAQAARNAEIPFADLDESWSAPRASVAADQAIPRQSDASSPNGGTAMLSGGDTGMLNGPSFEFGNVKPNLDPFESTAVSRWVRYGLPGNEQPLEISTDATIEPGVYYGGLTIGVRARVEMKPGLYIMAGGSFKLRSAAVDTDGVKVAYVPADLPTVEVDEINLFKWQARRVTLQPGIYFGDVEISDHQEIDVAPGMYVIAQGQFNVPELSLRGSGATLYPL